MIIVSSLTVDHITLYTYPYICVCLLELGKQHQMDTLIIFLRATIGPNDVNIYIVIVS